MSQQPYPPPPGARATLDPYTTAGAGSWYQRQVYYPEPYFPAGPNINIMPRSRPIDTLNDLAAGTAVTRRVQFDIPSAIYAITGGVRKTDASDFSVGVNPLDEFTVQWKNAASSDLYVTSAVLGGCEIGTAQRPRLVGGPGWRFGPGGALVVTVTPLIVHLQIDITFWCVEIRGGTSYEVAGYAGSGS